MNNRRNRGKKLVTIFLTLAMTALALSGCKKSGDSEDESKKKEFAYVPEYLQVDFGISSENMNVSSAVACGDVLYLVVSSWGEDSGSQFSLYKYNVAEKKTEKFPLEIGCWYSNPVV